jgi:hypothetical protein
VLLQKGRRKEEGGRRRGGVVDILASEKMLWGGYAE